MNSNEYLKNTGLRGVIDKTIIDGNRKTFKFDTPLNDVYLTMPTKIFENRIVMSYKHKITPLLKIIQGVPMFPTPLALEISKSKVAQTLLMGHLMVPNTQVCDNVRDLVNQGYAIIDSFSKLVTKEDNGSRGIGVDVWNDIDNCLTYMGKSDKFPFVVQPYIDIDKDIRVIMVGDKVVDAYERYNNKSFRKNISLGAESIPCDIDERVVEICKSAMCIGHFHFAHIDIIYGKGDDTPYLSEIAVGGGSAGSRFSGPELYKFKINFINSKECSKWEEKFIK